MTSNPLSSDFSYKKYSLEQLDNWVNDAVNCEDLTPQDIYETILKCVSESVKYHKKYYTKSVELLSLLKGNRPSVFESSDHDYEDFWNEVDSISTQYTEEELNAMCAAAEEKEKCREYNLREAEYYNKRAELDAQHSKYYYNTGRNKTYDEMINDGWSMTDDGFWIKEK